MCAAQNFLISFNHNTGLTEENKIKVRQVKMEQAKELWTQYLNWITTHPQLATDVETSIKWITYIATGSSKN